jgi:hypothetical protein
LSDIGFSFNLFNFNLYLNVRSEDAQTGLGIVDLLCIILGEVFAKA